LENAFSSFPPPPIGLIFTHKCVSTMHGIEDGADFHRYRA